MPVLEIKQKRRPLQKIEGRNESLGTRHAIFFFKNDGNHMFTEYNNWIVLATLKLYRKH